MSKGIAVGLTNLLYAKLVADVAPTTVGGNDGYATYDAPKRISGAITANFSPNASNDTIFADDGPYDTASTLGAMSLELNVADIPSDIRADLLGATYDLATGVVYSKSTDIPPYVAVGMSIKKSNGSDRYVWYLKGKFAAPDENNQTKADSINWNTPTITGNFLKRDADEQYRVAVDTDDAHITDTIKNSFFSSPNVGTLQILGAVTATPVSGTLSKGITTSVTIACATAGATIEYKLSTASVWSTYSAGISTAAWVVGKVVVNVRASLTGYATANVNFSYNVTE